KKGRCIKRFPSFNHFPFPLNLKVLRPVTLYGISADPSPVAFEKMQQEFLGGYSNPRRSALVLK
ncbi:MAG TPA: hypothetical protein V6D09_26680, partial [Leptolyngbyaceae cyanobacterium]